MDLTLYTPLFVMGILSFVISWIYSNNREFQLIIGLISWILLVVAAFSAFDIQRTVFDGNDWNTKSSVEYTFVLISTVFAIVQTLHIFILIMEYMRIGNERRKSK